MSSAANQADVQAVLEGIAQGQRDLKARIRPTPGVLPKLIAAPAGRGSLRVGDDGADALHRLAKAALANGDITQRADISEVSKALQTIFVERFVAKGLPVDQRNVDKLLSDTRNTVKQAFQSRTHFIPCHLSSDSNDIGLSLGAVRFISRREAKLALHEGLKAERSEDADFKEGDRRHLMRALSHYRGYPWFAQVSVADCSVKRSEDIAFKAATSALDLLQVIISARLSGKMVLGGTASLYERSAAISRNDKTGRLNISTGWSVLGQNLKKGWPIDVLDGEGAESCSMAGVVLEARLNPDLLRPLSERILDAAQWFGEATRDTSPSTKVVKYVTAIERLTLTMKLDEGLTKSVCERVAALTTGLIEGRTFEENKSAFSKVYGIRSDLVHGTMSPNDPKVAKQVIAAGDYAEFAILRALHVWGEEALRSPTFKNAELEKWFVGVVDWVKAGGIERDSGEVVAPYMD